MRRRLAFYFDSTMAEIGFFRKLAGRLNKGLLVVLKPLQIVNNFLFLAIAYFIGVGFSSILYRLTAQKKIESQNEKTPVSTYWRKMPPVSRDRNAWQRPF